jgi:hypothetical protein
MSSASLRLTCLIFPLPFLASDEASLCVPSHPTTFVAEVNRPEKVPPNDGGKREIDKSYKMKKKRGKKSQRLDSRGIFRLVMYIHKPPALPIKESPAAIYDQERIVHQWHPQ